MTTASQPLPQAFSTRVRTRVSVEVALTAALFAFLYARPIRLLVWDWWNNPEAGHGLLLAPIALYLAWKAGLDTQATPNRLLGGALIVGGVAFRYIADLASELFTMRGSMLMAALGITIWYFGYQQARRWWLTFTLLALSIPLPEVVLSRIALPLQFTASQIGAGLLSWRDIPVRLAGNVIQIPGHELFVAEACSGLRSLTALLSLSVLLGALVLRKAVSRGVLLAASIPIAIMLNGVRVFLTGFLVYFVDPKMGEGFMHLTEGWMIFVVAFALLGGVSWLLGNAESRLWPLPALAGGPATVPVSEPESPADEWDDATPDTTDPRHA